jgi:hypothetical protein
MTTSLAPTPDHVHALLLEHLDLHRDFPESARLRDLGAEKALVQDYSGRVVFELLQNALDRASEQILIRWHPADGILEVANDGRAISVHAVDGHRSDLTSLLTLHTSSKSAAQSVGNKGVGFRSVFASSGEVEVASRAADDRWWGMQLRHPAQLESPSDSGTTHDVASFYAPQAHIADDVARFHQRDGAPAEPLDPFRTLIRLRDVRNPDVVTASIAELQAGPLTFLERRAPDNLAIRIVQDDVDVEHILNSYDFTAMEAGTVELSDAVRANTGLDLQIAHVDVLVEKHRPEGRRPSRYWSYLPTEQPAGFGLQIHADFYLSNSRRNLALRRLREDDPAEDPAGWNARLVDEAAECVLELWCHSAVTLFDDYWRYATPQACSCPHLKRAVARRLWADNGAAFERMTEQSFPPGRLWPLSRYRDFFDAVQAWADYALRHISNRPRYKRARDLVARAQASGAPVLPIVSGDPLDPETRALDARPIVAGKQGQRKGADADRIYFLRYDPSVHIDLPPAVGNQRTFVTTFNPNLETNLPPQGLLPFDRLEILAQLHPGESEDEHRELLVAALDLAGQHGRGTSAATDRARAAGVGAAWRFVDVSENMSRAGRGLAGLLVPTTSDEWRPASDCGTARGPWPVVDLHALADAIGPERSLADACLTLGLGPIPLHEAGSARLPEQLPSDFADDLLAHWGGIRGYLGHERGQDLRAALVACRWLRPSEHVRLLHGVDGDQAPYRPLDVWSQSARGGFRTHLLPRILLDEREPPSWLRPLGIGNPGHDRPGRRRLLTALTRLRAMTRLQMDEERQDLLELYRRLARSLLVSEDPPTIPLLCVAVDARGQRGGLIWADSTSGAWHEPSDADAAALRSFVDVLHWVVRKQALKPAAALGLLNFRIDPNETVVQNSGASRGERADALHAALSDALPDLLVAGIGFHAEFDAKAALDAFLKLTVQHHDDVWVEWRFDGRIGTQGKDDRGDVFVRTLPDGRKELVFDGDGLPMAQCAYPLSELLAGNRAFATLFKDALHAWRDAAGGDRSSVDRFRREQGLLEGDVVRWKGKLQAAVMSPEEVERWARDVRRILSTFGELADDPLPGLVVRPSTFTTARDAHEDEVRKALSELEPLRPRVDFDTPNGELLDQALRAHRIPLLAEAAERNRGTWTEKQLNEWKTALDRPHAQEAIERRTLGFNPVHVLRRRLDLPSTPLDPKPDALSFARGQIPLASLPTPGGDIDLQAFRSTTQDLSARDAQDDEAFLRQARRRARGGKRAEDAVLDIAARHAIAWRRADPDGFSDAFAPLLPLFENPRGNKASLRMEAAIDEPGMRSLLHVALYVGNAGFDVLVPDRPNHRFLLVEVKRVATLEKAAFFLSENERRRRQEYDRRTLHWRLWLVSGTGESLDATSALRPFGDHAAPLESMAQAGLRPGEWFFVLR